MVNPPGWRRLWPSHHWLHTLEEAPGVWQWRIWSPEKDRLLACGAEGYTRVADALRGGKRFWNEKSEELTRGTA